MCGIAGGILFDKKPFDAGILQSMIDVISHRGPDDHGLETDHHVGLGFRRLSIIDLSPLGHQPMSSPEKKVWITFNGEIYNFEILRDQLEREGVVFKSKTDTEVIIQLYLRHGTDCFSMLRGMFGIAIWDSTVRELILARDRLGKKPLYYYRDHLKLLFGSELKSICQYPGIELDINPHALSEYFSYGFIASPRSIYSSVYKLEPGSFLRVNEEGQITENRYWNWKPPVKPDNISLEDAKQLLVEKVDESIKLRMRSDVPLGAFLSGGIDSTIVVGRMAQLSSEPIKTFTIGFKEKAYDESEYAGIVARKYNTEHHLEFVDPDYASLIEKIVSNFDEPFGDSSALPTFVVSEMISRHVTVALSGDGGDEVFGGYEIYTESLDNRKFDRIPSWMKVPARKMDAYFPETIPGRNYLRRFAMSNPTERFIERYKLISDPERKKLLTGFEFINTSIFKQYHFDQLLLNTDFLSTLQYNDMKHYMEGDILVKVDRTSMLNSIETRSPFLDHELIELAFTFPKEFLINNFQKKFILKEAFKEQIPEALLNRPKKGFSLPVAEWFRGPLKGYFLDTVFSGDIKHSKLINLEYVKKIFEIHLSGKRDLSFHLWLILSFAIWYNSVFMKSKMKTA